MPLPPAPRLASAWFRAPFDDLAALEAFAQGLDAVGFEFENIPPAALRARRTVLPGLSPLAGARNLPAPRARKKLPAPARLPARRFPRRDHRRRNLLAAIESRWARPACSKTAESGYDGKGPTENHAGHGRRPTLGSSGAAGRRGGGVVEGLGGFRRRAFRHLRRQRPGSNRAFPRVREHPHAPTSSTSPSRPARFAPSVLADALGTRARP